MASRIGMPTNCSESVASPLYTRDITIIPASILPNSRRPSESGVENISIKLIMIINGYGEHICFSLPPTPMNLTPVPWIRKNVVIASANVQFRSDVTGRNPNSPSRFESSMKKNIDAMYGAKTVPSLTPMTDCTMLYAFSTTNSAITCLPFGTRCSLLADQHARIPMTNATITPQTTVSVIKNEPSPKIKTFFGPRCDKSCIANPPFCPSTRHPSPCPPARTLPAPPGEPYASY